MKFHNEYDIIFTFFAGSGVFSVEFESTNAAFENVFSLTLLSMFLFLDK